MLLRRECGGKKNKHVGKVMNFSLILKIERTGVIQIFLHLRTHLSVTAGSFARRLLAGECCQFTSAGRTSFCSCECKGCWMDVGVDV